MKYKVEKKMDYITELSLNHEIASTFIQKQSLYWHSDAVKMKCDAVTPIPKKEKKSALLNATFKYSKVKLLTANNTILENAASQYGYLKCTLHRAHTFKFHEAKTESLLLKEEKKLHQ